VKREGAPAPKKNGVARGPRGFLAHGDCLLVLPTLSEKEQGFDLVYVDPPFNTRVHHGVRRGRGSRVNGVRAYKDSFAGVDAFLAMLKPRLAAVRDAMSARGSLFLHLDHRTVHESKVLCDEIFGPNTFRGEIIWVPGNGGRRKNGPSVTHQTLLVYSKGKDAIWNAKDPALREPFAETSLRMHFSAADADGRRFRERRIGGKTYRYYADQGRNLGSVWTDCPAMSANTPLAGETTGYPTQKPESLLERIVRAASLEDSRVLDPMCGSGTTLAVADRLGRRWVGIDQSRTAFDVARRRLGLPSQRG
jgi:site-specific DNA-methyltransferase (adenine-specific)